MASSSSRKKPRKDASVDDLQRLLHVGGITQIGLQKLLKQLQNVDVQSITGASRQRLQEANEKAFRQVARIKSMPLEAGGHWDWVYADSNKLLAMLAEHDKHLESLLAVAIQRHPPSPANPWHLVIGFDEFTPGSHIVKRDAPAMCHLGSAAWPLFGMSTMCPSQVVVAGAFLFQGNKLNLDQSKKVMVHSFTFREFGQAAMSSSSAWITPVVVRNSKLKEVCVLGEETKTHSNRSSSGDAGDSFVIWFCRFKVKGGWAHFFRTILEEQLTSPGGLSTAGVPLKIGGRVVLLYAKLSNVLADGEGHMKVWDWKGASAMKPCIKHYNVFKKARRCTTVPNKSWFAFAISG